MTATSPASEALDPISLLCGPTIKWICHKPGEPNRQFIGTVCERRQFHLRTGYTCSPKKL